MATKMTGVKRARSWFVGSLLVAAGLWACGEDFSVATQAPTDAGKDGSLVQDTGSSTDAGGTTDAGVDSGHPPTAPAAPNASANVTKAIRLTWTAPTDTGGSPITNYTITSTPATTPLTINATAALITGLTVGQSYTFKVRATTAVGTGPDSPPSNSVTVVDGPAPPALSACAANQSVRLVTGAVSGATSYNLYFGTATGVSKLSGTAITNAASPYVHAGRANGTKTYYVATAVNGSGVESMDSPEASATPDSAIHDTLFGHSYSGAKNYIEILDCLSQIPNGGTTVARKIQGASTGITTGNYNDIAIDPGKALVYFMNPSSIRTFANATTVDGDVAPLHVLTGGSTTIAGTRGLALDVSRDILYSSNGTSILVWTNASTKDGNVAPTATIGGVSTTLGSAGALYVDETNDRLYVANYTNVLVFNGVSAFVGAKNVAPNRTITVSGATLSSFGLAVDVSKDLLYVGSRDSGSIYTFASGSTVSGAGVPVRTITGASFAMTVSVFNNRIFSQADNGSSKISMWSNADTLTGAAVPDRVVNYPSLTAVAGFAYAP